MFKARRSAVFQAQHRADAQDERPTDTRPRRSWTVPEIIVSVGLAALVLVVHDVAYVLHAPYWNDEVWVAISLKAPLHDVPSVIASTPIGWDLLLRLVPLSHPQLARIVPLGFAGAAVLAAYWYVRLLPWPTIGAARVGAAAAAIMALLSPAALVRNDLKQYTCDAFCVLIVMMLTSHAERRPGWRSLGVLVAAGAVMFVFANPAALALGAALASLGLVALCRRDWRRLAQVGGATIAALVPLAAIYLGFYAHGNIPGLRQYWATNYLPVSDGPVAMWHWFWGLAPTWFHGVGVGPVVVAIPLLAMAAWGITRLGLPATGVVVPVMLVEMVALSAIKQYPVFDPRTMTFLAVAYGVTVAAGVVYWLTRVRAGAGVVGIACAVIATAAVVVWHGQGIRQHSIPQQPTRQDVALLKSSQAPGDVVVANVASTWSIAYYWGGPVTIVRSTHTQQKFRSYAVNGPRVLDLCPEHDDGSGDLVQKPLCGTPARIDAALTHAAQVAGPGHRFWFYNLQGRAADTAAVGVWAGRHHYYATRPDRAPFTMLFLFIPK